PEDQTFVAAIFNLSNRQCSESLNPVRCQRSIGKKATASEALARARGADGSFLLRLICLSWKSQTRRQDELKQRIDATVQQFKATLRHLRMVPTNRCTSHQRMCHIKSCWIIKP